MIFENYPRIQKLIAELELEQYVDTMEWHYLNQEQMNKKAEEVFQTYQDLISANIPQVLAARERVNAEYLAIGSKLHVFPREQARHELDLTNEDVTRIFSKVELGGSRYLV